MAISCTTAAWDKQQELPELQDSLQAGLDSCMRDAPCKEAHCMT